MSQQAPDPRLDVRGAVDLSSFGRPVAPPPGEPGGAPAAGGFVVDTTEATFQQVIEQSMQVPVVVLLWVATDEANARLATTLGRLVDSYEGAMLLARVDVQAYPQIAQAFQEFNGPYLITEGGPLNSTYVLALYIYDQSFRFFNLGYGAALSWVLFALVGGLSALSFWSSRYWVYYAGK